MEQLVPLWPRGSPTCENRLRDTLLLAVLAESVEETPRFRKCLAVDNQSGLTRLWVFRGSLQLGR